MRGHDALASSEIGDRAGDFEDAVRARAERPRRSMAAMSRRRDEGSSVLNSCSWREVMSAL
jgi:hypothetical protein